MIAHPGQVLVHVCRVEDEQEFSLGQAVDQQVVVKTPARSHQTVVVRATDLELRDVVAGQVLEEVAGLRAGHAGLTHVADVEQACTVPHGHVLVDQAAVLDRQLPTRERHDAAAVGDVAFV